MKLKNRIKYRFGDIRVVKKFLLFPRTIGNVTRWLEFAVIQERKIHNNMWEDMKWMDV